MNALFNLMVFFKYIFTIVFYFKILEKGECLHCKAHRIEAHSLVDHNDEKNCPFLKCNCVEVVF